MKFAFHSVERPEGADPSLWNDWKWQLRQMSRPGGGKPPRNAKGGFLSGATPYYLRLAGQFPRSGLKSAVYPSSKEEAEGVQQMKDPLGEEAHSPAPRIIHRYPDRVLFLVTDSCGIYCRYCTRKRFAGKKQALAKSLDYQQALSYIKSRPNIREVILSGGDPLTLSDSVLERILGDLRAIGHVEIIRTGSRMPAACPMRLTPQLIKIFKKHNPVFLMTHFNHPAEITKEAAEALGRVADSGILMFNQTVLLNGLNNHPALIQALMRRLLRLRVKPYYMFQCDPSEGTDHFRTSLKNSQWIQKDLWGVFSGLALPALSMDIPGGGGKAGFVPNFLESEEGRKAAFQGWDGLAGEYISPPERAMKPPPDLEDYKKEWLALKNQPYGAKAGFGGAAARKLQPQAPAQSAHANRA